MPPAAFIAAAFRIKLRLSPNRTLARVPRPLCPFFRSPHPEPMATFPTGNTLGLELDSLASLARRGVLGGNGQVATAAGTNINLANGNLVVQIRDEVLAARSADLTALRTYNSQGLMNDDNADNWSSGFFPAQLKLTGTINTTGSTLTGTSRDGAVATYTWNATQARYTKCAAKAHSLIGSKR